LTEDNTKNLRKIMVKFIGLLLLTATLSLASTIIYVTPTGSKDSSGDFVAANASITTGNGTVTVTLTNLLANTQNAGQLLSDFMFTLSITPTTAVNTTAVPTSATLIDVFSAGSGTFHAGTPTAWQVTSSGKVVHIDSLFDGPAQTIIGPGPFLSPNASITGNHNPFINKTATFTFNVAGVTSSTTVTAASFSFGTTAGDNVTGSVCLSNCGTTVQAVPEPVSFGLVGATLLCAGFIKKYRRA
jgi:hypothetical protein